jgi:anti-sigma factor RsiW
MNCEQISTILKAFGEGTLSAEESREVRVHLASCPACASRLSPADRMEILPALDDVIEPSEDFAARFRARLQEGSGKAASVGRPVPWWRVIFVWGRPWNFAAAGALTAILIAGVFWGGYFRGTQDLSEEANELSIAENLPLLEDMAVISNLDLLEDFDAIQNLTPANEGGKMQRNNP